MLPPLDPTLLSDYPRFADLYNYLTTDVISRTDGSTIAKNAAYQSTKEELNEARERNARTFLLIKALKEVAMTAGGEDLTDSTTKPLGRDVLEAVYVVAEYLESSLTGRMEGRDVVGGLEYDVEDLMADDIELFRQHLPEITALLSQYLIETEKTLSQIVSAADMKTNENKLTTIPTYKHTRAAPTTSTTIQQSRRHVPTTPTSLSQILSTRQQSHNTLIQTTIPALLSSLTTTLHTHTQLTTQLLTTTIRHLELSTHGSTSRHLHSHSAFLSTVATGIALKTQLLALDQHADVSADPDLARALTKRQQQLVREDKELERREMDLKALLAEYADEERWRVLGGRYAEVEEEIETVRRDVRRLERELDVPGTRRVGRW